MKAEYDHADIKETFKPWTFIDNSIFHIYIIDIVQVISLNFNC